MEKETFEKTSAMIRRFLSICVEFILLILSAVFIYLEELFRLLVPLQGKSLEGEIILVSFIMDLCVCVCEPYVREHKGPIGIC